MGAAVKLFLIAGEPSGDRLGAALMAGLKTLSPGISFAGVGGPMMQAEGLVSQFPMAELSVMGIAEVLPKYRHLKRRIRETADAVLASGARLGGRIGRLIVLAWLTLLFVQRLFRAHVPAAVAQLAVLPEYLWRYRPSGQYAAIKDSAKNLRKT